MIAFFEIDRKYKLNYLYFIAFAETKASILIKLTSENHSGSPFCHCLRY